MDNYRLNLHFSGQSNTSILRIYHLIDWLRLDVLGEGLNLVIKSPF